MTSPYPQQSAIFPPKPVANGYDLQSEKKRIAEITEEIKKELLEKWQKKYAGAQIFPNRLASANREMIDFLLSFQNTLFYNDLAKKFKLDQNQRDFLPQIVWQICLKKGWDSLVLEIQSNLKTDPSIAETIAADINQHILRKVKEFAIGNPSIPNVSSKKPAESRLEKMTITEALKAYPEITEQVVTSERIESKTQHGQVRPTIGNWLADYRYVLGFGQHEGIARGNYLFQSINGRKLSAIDRQKLAYVLKAYDENGQVDIDPQTKQLVFPVFHASGPDYPISQSTAQPKTASAITDLRKNVLPVEKKPLPPKPQMNPDSSFRPNFQTAPKTPPLNRRPPENLQRNFAKPSIESKDRSQPEYQKKDNMNGPSAPVNQPPATPSAPDTPPPARRSFPANFMHGSGNVRFSSPQTMPYEKNPPSPNGSPRTITDNSVVNLKKD